MNSRWVKSESILNGNDVNSNNKHDLMASLPKPGGPLKPRAGCGEKKNTSTDGSVRRASQHTQAKRQ